jgi:hypothetical protein
VTERRQRGYDGRVTRRLCLGVLGLGMLLAAVFGGQALAHTDGCHSAHSCPSDHHTYVWYDGSGQGLDCVKPGAPEYDSTQDTQTVSYGGYTYYCRPVGSAPTAPSPPPTNPTPDSTSPARTEGCGVERWKVKTLADRAAAEVNLRPRKTSVGALRRLADPHVGRDDPRTGRVERRTYSVRARLLSFAMEDDSDIHVVISDTRNRKRAMIAELPSTGCTKGVRTSVRRKMKAARSALLRACGRPHNGFTRLRGTATLTGVGFYDVKHANAAWHPTASSFTR